MGLGKKIKSALKGFATLHRAVARGLVGDLKGARSDLHRAKTNLTAMTETKTNNYTPAQIQTAEAINNRARGFLNSSKEALRFQQANFSKGNKNNKLNNNNSIGVQ